MSAKTFDAHQIITDQIVAALETGVAPWRQPWRGGPGSASGGLPLRANGVPYQGINVLLLWAAAGKAGFASPTWMTFRQAKELGGGVRKGEKSSMIVKYGVIEKEDGEGEEQRIPYLRAYNVFNVDQIDGLPASFAPAAAVDTGARPIAELEAFFRATGARIEEQGAQPHYAPGADAIRMPPIRLFDTARDYYATLAHELIHWTGHASRLDRLKATGADRRADYAFEELIAEIGSCFLGAEIGIEPTTAQSAAYVGSWLKALRDDKRHVFRAATAAQKAATFAVEASRATAAAAA